MRSIPAHLDVARAVRVDDVRRYFARRGWIEKPFVNPNLLHFEWTDRMADDGKPLYYRFPVHERFVDYPSVVDDFVRAMSNLEDRFEDDIWKELVGDYPAIWREKQQAKRPPKKAPTGR